MSTLGAKSRFTEVENALGASTEKTSVTSATPPATVALRLAIDQGAAAVESTLAARLEACSTATEAIP